MFEPLLKATVNEKSAGILELEEELLDGAGVLEDEAGVLELELGGRMLLLSGKCELVVAPWPDKLSLFEEKELKLLLLLLPGLSLLLSPLPPQPAKTPAAIKPAASNPNENFFFIYYLPPFLFFNKRETITIDATAAIMAVATMIVVFVVIFALP